MSHVNAISRCESTLENSEKFLNYIRNSFIEYNEKLNQLYENEDVYGIVEETEVMIAKLEANTKYIAEASKRMAEELKKANILLKKRQ